MDSTYDLQKIQDIEIDKEIKKSFIDYAMSVIVARALPDVRDGLKPVHRRILYAMYEDNLTHDKPYYKSATTVGNVLGRYHPHGDVAVYDTMVRMAQPFSLRYPLVEGHGNFGNVDGDGAAAYRYTESRLARFTEEMMEDIDKDVVDFVPNFDNKRKEPTVLPSRFPNLLLNGSQGIAVGMATNIPPHNLGEVVDGIIALIDNPDIKIPELVQYIKGPDFPTHASIHGTRGIYEGYMTGRGKVIVRAKADIEEYKNTHRIIVTEIPYQVNKSTLVESIADLVKDKRVDGITGIRDESGRAGMRIVIDLRRDAQPLVVLNLLYKFTQLQDTFSMNMLALVNGEPKMLNLKQILVHYVKHQQDVVYRRVKYDYERAKKRAHLLEGLKIALDNIDEVISIIRASSTIPEARANLIARFDFSEIQAQYIVEMPLGRLTGLERNKILDELAALEKLIAELQEILSDSNKILDIIKDDLLEIKRRYNDERRTRIEEAVDEIMLEDLISRQNCVVTYTGAGYIKRLPADTYQAQRRGGKGIIAMATKEEDAVEDLYVANSHDFLLFFSNRGRVYVKKCYEIPESGRTSKGTNIVNILQMEDNEKITSIIPVTSFDDKNAKYLTFITKNGKIKRCLISHFERKTKLGKIAITLEDDDELLYVKKTSGIDQLIISASNGLAIRISESSIRLMGRTARGVRGIRLKDDSFVAGVAKVSLYDEDEEIPTDDELIENPDDIADSDLDMDIDADTDAEIDDADDDDMGDIEDEQDEPAAQSSGGRTLITITENGFGKRCEFDRFNVKNRGGSGTICHRINEKTGALAGILAADDDDDIMLITDDGTIIRISVKDIPIYNNRGSTGVIVMRPAEGAKIIAIAKVKNEEEEIPEEPPAETTFDMGLTDITENSQEENDGMPIADLTTPSDENEDANDAEPNNSVD